MVGSLDKITNVATVPQLSPFRYPGGKTWLVPYIRLWLRSLNPRPRHLVEPFAGGAIVGLTALFEGLVERLTLVELDRDVGSVWQTILGPEAEEFADSIVRFEFTQENVQKVLSSPADSIRAQAFATLLKNRTRYGGILAPGAAPVRRGENGHGIQSRWYPQTLMRRVLAITAKREQIEFVNGDGIQYLRDSRTQNSTAYFIDPPYTVTGRRLYLHSTIDHDALFRTVCELTGNFLMTYDDSEEIRRLAIRYGLDSEQVPMKTTKHTRMMELLIGRDLEWIRSGSTPQQFGHDALLESLQTNGQSGS